MISKTGLKNCFVMSSIACFAIGSLVSGPNSLMDPKAHGTCPYSVQQKLKYSCDVSKADSISCFNRHYAEFSGYAFSHQVTWLEEIRSTDVEMPIDYFDSVTGKPLFKAPIGRSLDDFIRESKDHGWPSFRDEEVHWDNVRVLSNGETVSVDGTHLGHNLPDYKVNRFCINLVSIACYLTEETNIEL